MKLEVKKHRLGGYVKVSGYIAGSILLFMIGIYFLEKSEGNIAYGSYAEFFTMLMTLVRAAFVILSGVLLAKLVIEEYRSKTILLMFTYPISRKKLMLAKILTVGMFTFLMSLLTAFLLSGLFLLANAFLHFVPGTISFGMLLNHAGVIVLLSVSAAGMGLIPLYFGMKKKSVPAVFISSVLLVSLTNTSVGDFEIASLWLIPVLLGLTGFLIAYYSVRKVESEDAA